MIYEDHNDVANMDLNDSNDQDAYNAPYDSAPPGEEGFDFSHVGGEYEIFERFAYDLNNNTGR